MNMRKEIDYNKIPAINFDNITDITYTNHLSGEYGNLINVFLNFYEFNFNDIKTL